MYLDSFSASDVRGNGDWCVEFQVRDSFFGPPSINQGSGCGLPIVIRGVISTVTTTTVNRRRLRANDGKLSKSITS
jgi:hypothetical protein